jgi:putative flavoprotein involved in K+ transport
MFQFPNWSIQLPGYTYQTDDPDGYVPKDEIVRFLERYATLIEVPLRCDRRVVALRQALQSNRFLVETEQETFEAVNVVVATGPFHLPKIPTFATSMPVELFQVHSRDYRNPSKLPAGAVLVVGSEASGSQIAEELIKPDERSTYPPDAFTRRRVVIEAATFIGGLTHSEFGIVPWNSSLRLKTFVSL